MEMQPETSDETKVAEQAPNLLSSRAKSPEPKPKVYSRYPLPSERYPFSTHFAILARFVTHSRNGAEPISAERVEGSGIPKQAAQMNVRFLTSVGLLRFDSKGLYVPTPEAIRLVNARTVSEERARPLLRFVIQNAWFSEVAITALKSAPVVDEEALVGELALAAETNRDKKGPALRVLVDYLLWSGILRKDERGLSVADGLPAPDESSGRNSSVPARGEIAPEALPPNSRNPVLLPVSPTPENWHVVQTEDYFLKIRSDPAVVEDLRDQLSLLTKRIERIRTKSGPAQPPDDAPSGAVDSPSS